MLGRARKTGWLGAVLDGLASAACRRLPPPLSCAPRAFQRVQSSASVLERLQYFEYKDANLKDHGQ